MKKNIYIRKISHSPAFIILLVIALLLIMIPVLAPVLSPNDPIKNDYPNALKVVADGYPLGTDQIGRCVLSRLIWGGRGTLLITFMSVAIISVVGASLGMWAGYKGGRTDRILTRFTDMLLAIPQMVFVIAMVSILGGGILNTVFALVFVGWPEYFRITRGLVMSQKSKLYVEAARVGGFSGRGLAAKLILPNTIPYLLVNISQDIGSTVLTLSGLSLLGLASRPPTPEWGFMLSEGRKYIQSAPWLIIYPGVMIVIYVMVFNFLGDSLRDILDPRYERITRRIKRHGKEKSIGR